MTRTQIALPGRLRRGAGLGRRLALGAVGAALAGLPPAPLAAQACPADPAPAATVGVGAAHYRVGDGVDALEAGIGGRLPAGELLLTADYGALLPRGGDAGAHALRATGAYPLIDLWGLRACGVAYAGIARLSADADGATSVGGGLGVAVSRPVQLATGRVEPFLEVRGLAVTTSATILDVSTTATGLSLGGVGGVRGVFGRVSLTVDVAVDGLAGGLGITPYPARAVRLALGYGF